MGQHKTNPTAILAKQGKIPQKPKGLSKAVVDAQLRALILSKTMGKWFDKGN